MLETRALNRALLERQLLLRRVTLPTAAALEHLVGMQAQWPPAPYVGIWTRTTSFRREALERQLKSGAVIKATAMRQTLHLVTLRDYALLRAAFSESGHPDQWDDAKLVARLEQFCSVIVRSAWWRTVVDGYCTAPTDCIG